MMLATLLASINLFASKDVVPTGSVLSSYYTQGQLCVAVYFEDDVCNDVVFIGTYNSWSSAPSQCEKFVPITGYEGWYVVAVTDTSTTVFGKPVQLLNDGTFDWQYQTGDVASWEVLSGEVELTNGYSGECDIQYLDLSSPVVMVSKYFKNHNNPCTATKHVYTVNLKAPDCISCQPAIIGSFTNWEYSIPMVYDAQNNQYTYSFIAYEGQVFKFREARVSDWSNQILIQDAYGNWIENPNITLTKQEVINIDYSAGKYTTACYPSASLLADYYTAGEVCLCVYFKEEPCNAVVVTGSYNSCSMDPKKCAMFVPVEGYAGWRVAAFKEDSVNNWGKMIQLTQDSTMSWAFQNGDSATWEVISGEVEIASEGEAESKLQNMGNESPIYLVSKAFKHSPCGDIKHTYTLNLNAPTCNYRQPALRGDMNHWKDGGDAMSYDAETGLYTYTWTGYEQEDIVVIAAGSTGWTNPIEIPVVQEDESISWEWIWLSCTESELMNVDASEGRYALGCDPVPSAIEQTHQDEMHLQKVIRDGKVIIVREGVEYNLMGQML